jgi:periplasmic protein TonB
MRIVSAGSYLFSILFHISVFVVLILIHSHEAKLPVIPKPIVVDLIDLNIANAAIAPETSNKSIQPHICAVKPLSPKEEPNVIADADSTEPEQETSEDSSSAEKSTDAQPEKAAVNEDDSPFAQTATSTAFNDGKNEPKSRQAYISGNFVYIEKLIASQLTYPEKAKELSQQGTLSLSFVIFENGSVDEVKVIKSSGGRLLDDNAVMTVKKSAPYPKPPFPAEIHIPIAYNLE